MFRRAANFRHKRWRHSVESAYRRGFAEHSSLAEEKESGMTTKFPPGIEFPSISALGFAEIRLRLHPPSANFASA
jgi:hypothetical protein